MKGVSGQGGEVGVGDVTARRLGAGSVGAKQGACASGEKKKRKGMEKCEGA